VQVDSRIKISAVKMSNNDATNKQWRMAGSKKSNIGRVGDSKNQADHNGIY
jgi:hypothetical protein